MFIGQAKVAKSIQRPLRSEMQTMTIDRSNVFFVAAVWLISVLKHLDTFNQTLWWYSADGTVLGCTALLLSPFIHAANNELTTKNKTIHTWCRHNGTVKVGREGHSKEARCFQYGVDFYATAVRLAVHPITYARVVASVISACTYGGSISNRNP